MKRDLDILCEKLENCSNGLCNYNEIVCVKKALEDYAGGDINKLLKLKAQAKLHNANQSSLLDFVMKWVAVAGLGLTIIYNLSGDKISPEYIMYAFLAMIVIILSCGVGALSNKKTLRKSEWIMYIDTVIDEMISGK